MLDRLLGRLAGASRVQLLSFTEDERNFPGGPGEAYDYVKRGGYIRRVMGALGVTRWVVAEEFHKGRPETGYSHRGWTHWHVLADLSERGPLTPDDLRRVWRLWRDKWRIGGWDACERENRKCGSVEDAVRYIAKYMIKPGYVPKWFLDRKHCRMVAGSKALGALVSGGSRRRVVEVEREPVRRRASRTLAVAMACCRESCTVWENTCNSGGVLTRRYVGGLMVALADLVEASQDADVGWGLRALGLTVSVGPGHRPGSLQVFVELEAWSDVYSQLRSIEAYMDGTAWSSRQRRERIEQRLLALRAA